MLEACPSGGGVYDVRAARKVVLREGGRSVIERGRNSGQCGSRRLGWVHDRGLG